MAHGSPDGLAAGDDDPVRALDPAAGLLGLLARRAAESPDRPFLQEVTGRTLSYAQTLLAVGRWTGWLQSLGVGAGHPFVSLLPSSVDAQLLWLAAGSLGAWEVAVNPQLTGEFLRHALTDAGALLCFARPEQAGLAAGVGVALDVAVVGRDGSPADDAGEEPLRVPAPGEVSCVIYTSGTTGPAKGVLVTHGQMAASVGRIPRSWLGPQDAAYSCLPMFHITGRTPLLSMADVGGRVVLRERFSADRFWPDVREHRVTTSTVLAPILLAAPAADDDRDNPLRVVFGGPNPVLNARFAERFATTVVSCYGSTEAGFPIVDRQVEAAVARCGFLRPGFAARLTPPGSDGDAEVADDDVGDDDMGELWVRPPAPELVAAGYLGRPERTAAAFVDGWYRTGDLLRRLPDGSFRFVDRMGDTIRRLSENVSASEVEVVVARDPAVLECAVVGLADDVVGQEIALVYVQRPGSDSEPAAVHARLADALPRHMLPRLLFCVESLPTTPNGKVRRSEVAAGLEPASGWRPA